MYWSVLVDDREIRAAIEKVLTEEMKKPRRAQVSPNTLAYDIFNIVSQGIKERLHYNFSRMIDGGFADEQHMHELR